MRVSVSLVSLLAAVLLFVAGPAHAADDAIVARAYLKDENSQLTLQQATQQAFTPFEDLLSAGYQRNTSYWLRLTIRAGEVNTPPYVLRVRPTWHDEISLFDPADTSHPEPRVTGDQYLWSAG
jgi:hypothetical protein